MRDDLFSNQSRILPNISIFHCLEHNISALMSNMSYNRIVWVVLIIFQLYGEVFTYFMSSFKHSNAGVYQKQGHLGATKLMQSIIEAPTIRMTDSVMEKIRIGEIKPYDPTTQTTQQIMASNLISFLAEEKSGETSYLKSRIIQRTNGPVPRSHVPSFIVIEDMDSTRMKIPSTVFSLVEETMKWYLDSGGRVGKLYVSCPRTLFEVVNSMGFVSVSDDIDNVEVIELLKSMSIDEQNNLTFTLDGEEFRKHCESRLSARQGDIHTLNDIIGRLFHDMGDPKSSIKPYTAALQANPLSAVVFRNMGAAYHSIGELQLAFASYQQAIQLDESGDKNLLFCQGETYPCNLIVVIIYFYIIPCICFHFYRCYGIFEARIFL